MSYNDEPQAGGLISFTTILLVLVGTCVTIAILAISSMNEVNDFKSSCKAYGGSFQQLANTSCALGHKNCLYNCYLHDKVYNLDELGSNFLNSYSQFFCIEDCKYINEKAGKYSCIC